MIIGFVASISAPVTLVAQGPPVAKEVRVDALLANQTAIELGAIPVGQLRRIGEVLLAIERPPQRGPHLEIAIEGVGVLGIRGDLWCEGIEMPGLAADGTDRRIHARDRLSAERKASLCLVRLSGHARLRLRNE